MVHISTQKGFFETNKSAIAQEYEISKPIKIFKIFLEAIVIKIPEQKSKKIAYIT